MSAITPTGTEPTGRWPVPHRSRGCYTFGVPTTRRRHVITETDAVSRALEDAAKRWPEDSHHRSKLLLHLLEEGHRAVVGRAEERVAARRDGVASTAGALTGSYGADYLCQLREEWPR